MAVTSHSQLGGGRFDVTGNGKSSFPGNARQDVDQSLELLVVEGVWYVRLYSFELVGRRLYDWSLATGWHVYAVVCGNKQQMCGID
jgi:hypothetical protein